MTIDGRNRPRGQTPSWVMWAVLAWIPGSIWISAGILHWLTSMGV